MRPLRFQPSRSLGLSLLATALLLGCGLDVIPIETPATPGPGEPAGEGGSSPSTQPPASNGTGGSNGGTGGVRGGTGGSGGRSSDPPATGGSAGASNDGGAAPVDAAATPVVPGGPGVTINGKFVPREKAVVFLHIGHSNMAGRATTPADLKPFFYDVDPQLWSYGKGGTWRAAREPLAPDDSTGNAAGPGMALLRTALSKAAPDTHFISIGHGHSGSFGGTCAGFRKNALLYDIVMGPARELKGRVTFGGIFTMLGQSEYRFPPNVQMMLADCLAAIASEMRADLEDPEIPFIVGDYEAGISRADIAPTSRNGQTITAQLRMAPDKISRAAVVPTEGLPMQDTHHFNMAGHKGWAERAIDILLTRTWARWK